MLAWQCTPQKHCALGGAAKHPLPPPPPPPHPFLPFFFPFLFAGQCLLFIILPPHVPSSSCSRAALVGSDMNNSLYRHLSCYLYLSRKGKASAPPPAPMGVSGTALLRGLGCSQRGSPCPGAASGGEEAGWEGAAHHFLPLSGMGSGEGSVSRGGGGREACRWGPVGLRNPAASPPRCLVGWLLSPVFPWLPGSVGVWGLRAAVPLL